MKIDKHKNIGQVLFIVEGSRTEFIILKKIFCDIFGYSYIEKRRNRNKLSYYVKNRYSTVCVFNSYESNIKYIEDKNDYLDNVLETAINECNIQLDNYATFYLFDRDPKSNSNPDLIKNYINVLNSPYANDNSFINGQLLLSYPSIESYTISAFVDNPYNLKFKLGSDAKTFIGQNKEIQINKYSDSTVLKAAEYFLDYLSKEEITLDIDDFSYASKLNFERQELNYLKSDGFRCFSMLTLAFLQLGIIEID